LRAVSQADRLWLVIGEQQPAATKDRRPDEQMLAGFANAGRWD
jgi:hypothetical protein